MQSRRRWPALAVVLATALLAVGTSRAAQGPDAPPEPPLPPIATLPPASAPAASSEAVMRAEIEQLKSMVEQLSTRVQQIQEPPQGVGTSTTPPIPGTSSPASTNPNGGSSGAATFAATGVPPGLQASGRASGGALAPGQGAPATPSPMAGINMPPVNRKDPLQGIFGPGFMLKSADDEYVLQFHDLTQIEFRGYQQGGQNPVRDTFAIPRQWYMFSGRITKPVEYFVSIQQAYDTILPLDVFLNFNYDQRLQLRVGRMKTPFTYEFFELPLQGLVSPERSLFFNNFALNRQIGGMLWGQVFDRRVDYAAGIYNTTQNGNLDSSDGKDFLGFLNYRPFLKDEGNLLQYLNVGGSVDVGDQFNTPIPQTLRTSIATTGSNIIGSNFLAFNNNVRQAGAHTFWDLHAALYYKQLSLIAEWQQGFQDYAFANNLGPGGRTHLPVDSYYVQAGYFVTGETVSGRGVVKPMKNFDLRKGKRGPGAIELNTRYNSLLVGKQVFSNGLADPNLWSNRVYTASAGVNWYLNTYVKLMFNWEHAEFGDPVLFAPGRRQISSDTFFVRFQLYF